MKIKRSRLAIVMGLCFFVAFLIVCKMLFVQVIANDRYSGEALHNRLKEFPIMPNRGVIYGANGEALAISVEKDSVYVTPSVIKGAKKHDEMVENLAKALHMKVSKIEKIVNGAEGDFVWLKRHAEPSEIAAIKKLDYMGVGFTPEFKREYPKGRLACQTLGYAGTDNTGLAGIELEYNDELMGKEGRLVAESDNQGNVIPQSVRQYIPASPGEDVHLTIDETIQYIVERELKEAQKKLKAKEMICLMMNVKTGEILAMADIPTFDPNNFGAYDPETWKNLSVSKLYEPGSTFKVLTSSMALEDNVVNVNTQFYCNGALDVDGVPLKCWIWPGAHGNENFKQAIENSCNVAVGKVALALGKDRFYDYIRGFGMDQVTGVDLPGESTPILLPKDRAVRFDLAAMGIGQTNAYTPIQMLTAISASVNGGYLMKPHVVNKITDRNGNVVKEMKPEVVRQVISRNTSKEIIDILEGVVTEGIGKDSKVPGYRVGGKTGTGETVVDGTYTQGVYHFSFAGFAPVEDPTYACIVVVNHPEVNSDSGKICGPIFSKIMEDTLRYKKVPKTIPEKEEQEAQPVQTVIIPEVKLPGPIAQVRQQLVGAGLNTSQIGQGDEVAAMLPFSGTKVATGTKIELYTRPTGASNLALPDMTGKTIKEVEYVMRSYGLAPIVNGSGLAYRQYPLAGNTVNIGDSVSFWFASSEDIASIIAKQNDLEKQEKKRQEAEKKEKSKAKDKDKEENEKKKPAENEDDTVG